MVKCNLPPAERDVVSFLIIIIIWRIHSYCVQYGTTHILRVYTVLVFCVQVSLEAVHTNVSISLKMTASAFGVMLYYSIPHTSCKIDFHANSNNSLVLPLILVLPMLFLPLDILSQYPFNLVPVSETYIIDTTVQTYMYIAQCH